MRLRDRTLIYSLLIAGLGLVLAGCAAQPQPQWVLKKQTVKQLRSNYVHILQQNHGKVIELGETMTIIIPSNRLYRADSANFIQSNLPVLNAAAKLLATYQKETVKVTAYSDNQQLAGAPANRKLALTTMQAQRVAAYLSNHHSNARLLYARGFGSKQQIAWNGSRLGRQLNKRVQISFRFYPRFKRYS